MQLDIGLHTIILLVGPSQSGKSTWTEILASKIKEIDDELRVSILSSDNLRRELIGENLDRYHPQMMESSEAAFDLLFAKLKVITQYPINHEFVVIDTTGLDAEFRKKIQQHAKDSCYRTAIVAFDYSHHDYFKDLVGFDAKNIVGKHVDMFKKTVLPNIKRKSYDYSLTIKDKNLQKWNEMTINVNDYDLWRKCNFTEKVIKDENDIMIIGDVHENIVPVKSLLEKYPEKKVFFVGDIIDKGANTKEAVEYTVELIKKGAILVRGNHESFVARRIKGEVPALHNENDLFPSLIDLFADEDLKEKFMWMYEQSLPFACVKTHGKTVYITHAPCFNKYIGKLDNNSQKFQRNFYFSSREKNAMIDELEFMKDEAKYSHPLHVFGHVAHDMKQVEQKNKIWLDTGSIYGNQLTALIIDKKGNKKYVHEKTEMIFKGDLFSFHKELNNDIIKKEITNNIAIKESNTSINNEIDVLMDKYNLSSDKRYWLNNFNKSGASFISGTMSPSRSSETKLEPIETALDYFYSKGVNEVIIEPKYMGSRLQVYLFRDKNKDFGITRSGHKIGFENEMKIVFEKLHEKFDNQNFWKESIIFDGELLPWSLIAEDLIDKDFLQYGRSIENEISILNNDSVFKSFNIDNKLLSKNEKINTFLEQAKWFGKKDVVEYKPFSILKVDEQLWVEKNQEDVFNLINDSRYLVCGSSRENYEKANHFFNELTNNLGHEGVVIKPVYWKKGIAPYIKVRNENYLHLIYGYDYQLNYEEKIKTKRTGKKLDLSIKEYELGLEMLQTNSKIELLNLACLIQFEIDKEKELDIRL